MASSRDVMSWKKKLEDNPAIKIATDSSILSLRKHAFLVEDILWQIILPTYMFIVLEGNKHKSQVNWQKVHLNPSFLS